MNEHKYPLISVLTCTYNSEALLEKALRSVETQSYPNIEHIFNDSHSCDATCKMIEAYTERNKGRYPIKLIRSDAKGVANALNTITPHASGDVLHYLHSDDYYVSEDALERAAQYFQEEPDLQWLTGNFLIEIRGRQLVIPHTPLLRLNPEKALSTMNIIHHENTFVRRGVVEKYGGFNENPDSVVEYSIWLRLIQDHKPRIVNEEFTVFIIHKGSTSTGDIRKFSQAILRAFNTQKQEKVFPFLGYYADKDYYKKFKLLEERAREFLNLLEVDRF